MRIIGPTFRWGSVPAVTHGGWRSIFLRQLGGLAYYTSETPVVGPSPGGGFGTSYSRKRFMEEIQWALQALREARAIQAGLGATARKTLAKATDAAEEAITAARESEAGQSLVDETRRLRSSLEAVTATAKIREIQVRSMNIEIAAKSLERLAQDDDEEATFLLLN